MLRSMTGILVCIAACWQAFAGTGVSPSRGNVLLVTIDTLRADRLSCYGYARNTDPNLVSLAAEGIIFLDVTTAVPLTLPSHVSLLTGLYPTAHGVRDNGVLWKSATATLAELFLERGFDTAAFVSSFILSSRFGLSRGFELYDDNVVERTRTDSYRLERSAGETIGQFLKWLDQRDSKPPFFVWLHLFEPHKPYLPAQPFAERFVSPYDAEIASADAALGRLFEDLRQRAMWDGTTVVVTSDHGEGLGDHGENTHGYFVYQSTMRIPLILKGTKGSSVGQRVERPVHLIDVAPTLLRLAGLSVPPGMQGQSLREALGATGSRNRPSPRPLYSESFYFLSQFSWAPFRVLREGKWKLIAASSSELYDLSSDPGEERDLSTTEAPRLRALEQKLQALVERLSTGKGVPDVAADRETVERLHSLGYSSLSFSRNVLDFRELPDPRTRLDVFQAVKTAERLIGTDTQSAVARLRSVVDSHPRLLRARELLALSLEEAGRVREAALEYEVLEKELPLSSRLAVNLALVYERLEEAGRGVALLERAVEVDSENFLLHYHLGRLRSISGEIAGASRSLHTALRLEPHFAEAHYSLGQVLRRQQEIPAALEHFQRAADLGSDFKEAHNNAAICLVMLGRLEEAVADWQRALSIDPAYQTARQNLVQALEDLGRVEEADRFRKPPRGPGSSPPGH